MPPLSGQYIPQYVSDGSRAGLQYLMWGGAAACALIWMGMIVGAPFALANGWPAVAQAIYKGFSPICHQLADRSLHLEGHAFAVCSRCTGIYAGFASGIILYPLVRSLERTNTPRRTWLIFAVVPLSIDWALGVFNIWANTHLSRLLTGALFGVVVAFYVVPGLMDVLRINWRTFFSSPSHDRREILETTSTSTPDRAVPSDYSSPSTRI